MGTEKDVSAVPVVNSTLAPAEGKIQTQGGVEPAGKPASNPVIVPGGALQHSLARERYQQDFVLRVLEERGLNWQHVLAGNDEAGVKASVRAICQQRERMFTDDVFKKTWQKLRDAAREAAGTDSVT